MSSHNDSSRAKLQPIKLSSERAHRRVDEHAIASNDTLPCDCKTVGVCQWLARMSDHIYFVILFLLFSLALNA